jgi:hypothetical protein
MPLISTDSGVETRLESGARGAKMLDLDGLLTGLISKCSFWQARIEYSSSMATILTWIREVGFLAGGLHQVIALKLGHGHFECNGDFSPTVGTVSACSFRIRS